MIGVERGAAGAGGGRRGRRVIIDHYS
eukprot:SAG31_NODE_39880_length_284_cov_24.302703_1_plen_26_part_10